MEMGMAYYELERPAEAVPILNRFIDSYPFFIQARYVLAAAYVDLGLMEQARAEAGEVMKINPKFSLETGIFTGVDPQDRLLSDLRKAGLK